MWLKYYRDQNQPWNVKLSATFQHVCCLHAGYNEVILYYFNKASFFQLIKRSIMYIESNCVLLGTAAIRENESTCPHPGSLRSEWKWESSQRPPCSLTQVIQSRSCQGILNRDCSEGEKSYKPLERNAIHVLSLQTKETQWIFILKKIKDINLSNQHISIQLLILKGGTQGRQKCFPICSKNKPPHPQHPKAQHTQPSNSSLFIYWLPQVLVVALGTLIFVVACGI